MRQLKGGYEIGMAVSERISGYRAEIAVVDAQALISMGRGERYVGEQIQAKTYNPNSTPSPNLASTNTAIDRRKARDLRSFNNKSCEGGRGGELSPPSRPPASRQPNDD